MQGIGGLPFRLPKAYLSPSSISRFFKNVSRASSIAQLLTRAANGSRLSKPSARWKMSNNRLYNRSYHHVPSRQALLVAGVVDEADGWDPATLTLTATDGARVGNEVLQVVSTISTAASVALRQPPPEYTSQHGFHVPITDAPKAHPMIQGAAAASRTPVSRTARGSPRDPIQPPSQESGGIPEPSSAYLLRSSFLPRRLTSPRQILVIIDLNGTMLFRPSRKNPSRFVERPLARPFLDYCIRTFNVAIWSSARPENVSRMCGQLLAADQLGRVLAIWGRDRFGLSRADYDSRVMCYKRLSRLWADPDIARQHPGAGAGERWDQGNTVLIDDTVEKARSEPYNAIQIPEFTGDTAEEPAILPQVHDYLNTLAHQADISTYIRTTPFRPQE